jgi:hypothetical protein
MRPLLLIAAALLCAALFVACNEAADNASSSGSAPTATEAGCRNYCDVTAACGCDASLGCDDGNVDRCVDSCGEFLDYEEAFGTVTCYDAYVAYIDCTEDERCNTVSVNCRAEAFAYALACARP